MGDSQLYSDSFTVGTINNQKYDRVSRISATSIDGQTIMTLDINHELYSLQPNDAFDLTLASTLNLDGTKDEGRGWREKGTNQQDLSDMYDYVCYGKVYRFEEGDGENIKVYVSFGGLLLYLEGPYKRLTPLRIDYVYLLMKK
ncbi:DNA-directed RNA polymerase II subunit H [Coniosporium apollinis CBS 100218]|uniref:DNA-directed RNA polymerases I, II, and III subunit RPABC3 n=1 Tax=Coniosporium apollinis (strain CBS 100218) TaxID=1168221 RepID=R7YGG6_CONA1|nr:DNA-directed RNA polymerase II subunit H [Coniosporium apollinis CBS 100218]EON60985.1 DNA-directed RNA polymerase II subunit H [Coniosporium apollinis CBS 100218]